MKFRGPLKMPVEMVGPEEQREIAEDLIKAFEELDDLVFVGPGELRKLLQK